LPPRGDYALVVSHEYGHCKQSEKLGPLYIFIIGIPSTIGNLLARVWPWLSKHYYNQPWEAWADRLGSVKRGGKN
jgi:hypothetical protein